MSEHHTVEWMDRMHQPQVPFHREAPWGKDIDVSQGQAETCTVDLDWPALRCGVHIVTCRKCGLRVGLTTAGRVDDPRSVKIACRVADA